MTEAWNAFSSLLAEALTGPSVLVAVVWAYIGKSIDASFLSPPRTTSSVWWQFADNSQTWVYVLLASLTGCVWTDPLELGWDTAQSIGYFGRAGVLSLIVLPAFRTLTERRWGKTFRIVGQTDPPKPPPVPK